MLASCDVDGQSRSSGVSVAGARIDDARVDHVKDGDSLVVMHDGEKIEVRLFGIDAPEKNQPFARESSQAARRLMNGQPVDLIIRDRDRYQRLVADVYVDDSAVSVNLQLVAMGAAWAYTRYSEDPALIQAQDRAREQRAGLWALPASERIAPWVWRKSN